MPDKIKENESCVMWPLYAAIAILPVLFARLLYFPIAKSFFELDLLWFMPTILREASGLSWMKLGAYLLSPFPLEWGVPTLKFYGYFIMSFFGPVARNFILFSIILHFFSSVLLFLVSRALGVNRRISLLAMLMYFTLFAHFHAYTWPMAFQHIAVVFFILLVLWLYLKADALMDDRRGFYGLTLAANFIASFCRASILILPFLVLAHILYCAPDRATRLKKYDRWLPLFAAYLIYPLVTFSAGDPRVLTLAHRLPLPFTARFAVLLGMGAASLFLVRLLIRNCPDFSVIKRRNYLAPAILIILAVILVKTGGLKRFLIPYNIMLPFTNILVSFLRPFETVLSMDSARPWHFIPFRVEAASLLLAAGIITVFVRGFLLRNRALIILVAWYAADLGYLYLRNPLPSRYFIYLSPLFCIIFCAVFDYLYNWAIDFLKLKTMARGALLAVIFTALCIPNLLAIKFALMRGRLANTFMTYDYISTADAIRDDVSRRYGGKGLKGDIYINGVMPVKFIETGDFSGSDLNNDNARFIFAQAIDKQLSNIKINAVAQSPGQSVIYSLNGYRINNAEGQDIGHFSSLFEEGVKQLNLGNSSTALDLFEAAERQKPFLFRYILGDNPKLEDLEWITGGSDLRTWINKVICFYTSDYTDDLSKTKYVSSIINREIDDYIRCIFYIAHLKYASGKTKEGDFWLSRIGFLDSDYNRLISRLNQPPLITGLDKKILCVKHDDYLNRFKFEKFIFNLTVLN